MILRRITANFRRQDWMAVVIELVIVILGVFIGIQVSNWNQARADAQLGHDYAKRLANDLNTDLAGVRAESAYYSAVLQSVRKTDELLREPDSDPREPAALKTVAAALRSNPGVAASLRYQYSFAVNATTNVGRLKSNIEDALDALGAESETVKKKVSP